MHRPIPDIYNSLPMLLLRGRKAVMKRFRPVFHKCGVTESQWRVIRVLNEGPSIEVTKLARSCHILSPSLSRILRDMEVRKLVRRRTMRRDKRRSMISITALGRKVFAKVAPHFEAGYADIALALGEEKLDALYALLNDLEEALSADEE